MEENILGINNSNEYLIFDLDADGDMDLLEIGKGVKGGTNATRWYYDGENFQKDVVTYGFSSFNQDNNYVVVDANNDGLPDLVEVWQGKDGTANATTYWGDQEGRFGSFGNFTYTWNFGEFNPSKYSYVGIDYNNDGWQDLVRRNNNPLEGEEIWQPYLGDGEGQFVV